MTGSSDARGRDPRPSEPSSSDGPEGSDEAPKRVEYSRTKLKGLFYDGTLPWAEVFEQLIDSTVNRFDDGFDRTPTDGLRLTAEEGTVLSVLRRTAGDHLWRMEVGKDDELVLTPYLGAEDPTLTLTQSGSVGIGTKHPEAMLDVDGFLRSRGRVGAPTDSGAHEPVADGAWHTIIDGLAGIQALEVVASAAGNRGDGEYAVVHAFALNAFNARGWYFNPFGFNFLHRKNKVRVHRAYYRGRRDRLELRWAGGDAGYRLQIRTRRAYRNGAALIRCHVTNLLPWSGVPSPSHDLDELMPGAPARQTPRRVFGR